MNIEPKKIRNPQLVTMDKNELDVINDFIEEATTFYKDNRTPVEYQSEKLALKLYDTLYKWRDSQPE